MDTRRKRQDGIRSLAGIKRHCKIDKETGCWLWQRATSEDKSRRYSQPITKAWLPQQKRVGTAQTMTALRAAWILAGNTAEPGNPVWRSVCWNRDCCNPAHAKTGTQKDMGADLSASGRLKGQLHRVQANTLNRMRMVTPVEKVREAEGLFANGATQKAVRRATGLGGDTVQKIKHGKHPHSAGRIRMLPGASIFSLAQGA